jgi:hypothetical protein
VEADLDVVVVIVYRLAHVFFFYLRCAMKHVRRDMFGPFAQRTGRNSLNDVSRRQ